MREESHGSEPARGASPAIPASRLGRRSPGSPRRGSLAVRALLAIALMIGFYVFALAISGALIAGPLLVDDFPARLLLLCWFAGGVVLWSIAPRIERFEEPGPRLEATQQPRLFQEIQSLARATEQPMPEEVYLLADVNAFVARRGGFMGLFSRPVLGIGLPLAASLSAAELRAVLAHEFGHFYGGDTHLGPWIYKTRGAVMRTVGALHGADSWFLRLVHWPFRGYGEVFLRITQGISRQQELTADQLSARIAGGRPAAAALRKVQRAALTYSGFLDGEYAAALGRGFRPPLAEGFTSFLSAAVARGLDEAVARVIDEQRQDVFDSHPPTRERIAALAAQDDAGPSDDGPSLAWFERLHELEERLLERIVQGTHVSALRPLSWSEVSEKVWIPAWRESCERHAAELLPATVADLPDRARRFADIGKALAGQPLGDEQARAVALQVFGGAFALALVDAGWTLHADPGIDFRATRGEHALEPFAVLRELAAGSLDPATWRGRAEELGIAALELRRPSGASGQAPG